MRIIGPLQTKMIATLGPATKTADTIQALIAKGVTVCRLNLAHGTHDDHSAAIRHIRAAEKKTGLPVGILLDLPGPKIRVGAVKGGALEIRKNQSILLTAGRASRFRNQIPIDYPFLIRDLKPKQSVFIADGLIQIHVTAKRKNRLIGRAATGGTVRTGNGVNLPDSKLALRAFTKEDERHLAFGLKQGVDFVGLSFAAGGGDVRRVRSFCRRHKAAPFLIAKIERSQAIDNLKGILKEADGLMVARGDLGVEIPFSQIPGHQHTILQSAHRWGKPVILATQVLESMIQNPRPTRAEATDIATAIWEGADAIMLSGETSIGKYPLETVGALRDVITETEKRPILPPIDAFTGETTLSVSMAREACHLAERVKAPLIVVPTRSGGTASRVSRFRPSMPILAFVSDPAVRRRFTLFRGLHSLRIGSRIPLASLHSMIKSRLKKEKLARSGENIVIVSGAPGLPVGETGMVQVLRL